MFCDDVHLLVNNKKGRFKMGKRLVYVDAINVVATFSVLMLHASQWVGKDGNIVKNQVVQVIVISAIFLFLMNSGATLIDYTSRYTTKSFLVKRLKRVVFPLVVWSILWYVYDIFFMRFLDQLHIQIQVSRILLFHF